MTVVTVIPWTMTENYKKGKEKAEDTVEKYITIFIE